MYETPNYKLVEKMWVQMPYLTIIIKERLDS